MLWHAGTLSEATQNAEKPCLVYPQQQAAGYLLVLLLPNFWSISTAIGWKAGTPKL